MKAFVKKFIIFILLFYLVFGMYFYYSRDIETISNWQSMNRLTGGWGHSLERFREVNKYDVLDILFIGSSHAYRGFDTRIFKKFGYETFNLGTTSQSPINSYYLLKEFLPKLSPRILVVEVYWDVLAYGSGAESCLDIISNMPLSKNLLKMVLEANDERVWITLLGNIFSRALKPLKDEAQRTVGFNKYISGGFVEVSYSTEEMADKIKRIKRTNEKINENQIKYLKKIIDLAKENNIKVVFVRAPVVKEFKESIENYSEITEPVMRLAKENDIDFYDLTSEEFFEAMDLNSQVDFYDLHHMTQSGVEKFNKFFIAEMRNAYPLTNGDK